MFALHTSLKKNLSILLMLSFIKGFTTNKCDFNVKLKQTLRNEGLHRNITYGIVFSSDDGGKWSYQDCVVGLEQTLPSGVYANPDELGDLRRTEKLNAIPKNRINVELPTEQSEPSIVYMTSKVTDNKVHLWLPVHARYHQAVSGGGYARNEIGPPKLYLQCPDQRLDVCDKVIPVAFLCNGSSKEKCTGREIPYTVLTEAVVWAVPVGDTQHYYWVAGGSGAAAALAALAALHALHARAAQAHAKRL